MVGVAPVLQHIPRSVTEALPAEVTFPPDWAEVAKIDVAASVAFSEGAVQAPHGS